MRRASFKFSFQEVSELSNLTVFQNNINASSLRKRGHFSRRRNGRRQERHRRPRVQALQTVSQSDTVFLRRQEIHKSITK